MEEKVFMDMYQNMFGNFQEQARLFMVVAIEKQKNNESMSVELLDRFKANLNAMLNTLAGSIDSFKDENFKNFYKSKVNYYYQYIEDLSKAYDNQNSIKK